MSFANEVAQLLRADAILTGVMVGGAFTGLLTGGVYEAAVLGDMGITDSTTTKPAYSGGKLRPVALVRERATVPTGDVLDYDAQIESARQMVEVWLYVHPAVGYGVLDSAAARVRTLLMGTTLSDSFELRLALWLKRERAPELAGALLQRLDWQIDFVME